MKLSYVLQLMLDLLMIFALAISVSAVEDNKTKEKNPKVYVLVPAYILAAVVSFIFLTWAIWHSIRNWGSWKLHAPTCQKQYIRTALGWVDRETWDRKQAKRAKREEAKRDQHRFYRTTKADYKWIFYDPTGELQQRVEDQKERSYLRMLPSWMRSYPHGTLQTGTLANQRKAPKDIFQLLESQTSSHSRLSLTEALEHSQLDGYPMSGALHDASCVPNLPIMEYPDATNFSAPGKSCLLAKLTMMDEQEAVEVWLIRPTSLPERTGIPRLQTEEELDGEIEPQETVIQSETEQALEDGRHQAIMNDLLTQSRTNIGRPLLPVLTTRPRRHSLVFSRPPVQDPPSLETRDHAGRRERYILDLELRIQRVRNDPTLMLVHGTLDILERELRQARGSRPRHPPIVSAPPVQDPTTPEAILRANRLQNYIEGLERRIHDLRTESPFDAAPGLLNSLMHELHRARASRARLVPIASLRPAVPTSQGQLQSNQDNQQPAPVPNTTVNVPPRPEMIPGMRNFAMIGITVQARDLQDFDSVERLHRIAIERYQNFLRDVQNHYEVRNAPVFHASIERFYSLFRAVAGFRVVLATHRLGLAHPFTQILHRNVQILNRRRNIQTVNASAPTIVTPQVQGEIDHATTEGPTMDDNTNPDLNSEALHGEGDRAVVGGSTTNDTSSPDAALEVETQPHNQHPIAAALLRSIPPHRDPAVGQARPAAHRFLGSEETIRAEAIRQTTSFYTDISHSEPVSFSNVQESKTNNEANSINTLRRRFSSPAGLLSLDVHGQESDTENEAESINSLRRTVSSPAAQPSQSATATPSTMTVTWHSSISDEDLYSDKY